MRTASQDEMNDSMTRWRLWMEDLAAQDKLIPGHRLTHAGKVLKGKKKELTDGPFVESKEVVGGFIGLRAQDMDEATMLAEGCPIFNYDGSVEVREILVM